MPQNLDPKTVLIYRPHPVRLILPFLLSRVIFCFIFSRKFWVASLWRPHYYAEPLPFCVIYSSVNVHMKRGEGGATGPPPSLTLWFLSWLRPLPREVTHTVTTNTIYYVHTHFVGDAVTVRQHFDKQCLSSLTK
jgi:hypothetical protein